MSPRCVNHLTKAPNQWFIVQYMQSNGSLVHRLVTNYDFASNNSYLNEKGVLNILDNGVNYSANVMHISESEDDFLDQFEQLKRELAGSTGVGDFDIEEDVWMLVQYSAIDLSIHYTVLNCNQRYWNCPDLFEDIAGFMCDPYRMILKKSSNRELLKKVLNAVSEACLKIPFPLVIPTTNEDEHTLSKDDLEEYDEMVEHLESVERKIKEESRILVASLKTMLEIQNKLPAKCHLMASLDCE